jgi:uncharacterized membrane protein YkvA (DUF1232 family)
MPALAAPRTKIVSLPETLNRHLTSSAHGTISSTASYIDRGAALVDAQAIAALKSLRVALQAKIDQLAETEHLRRRLDLLALYFDEATVDGQHGTQVHREVTFALLYFLKGFDRIPDTIPEVGLLDDAMIVQMVMQRQAAALRTHWLRRRRNWPVDM